MNHNPSTRPAQSAGNGKTPPSHIAKVRHGEGDQATYSRIGVAWEKPDGSMFVRLHGVQIVSDGFTLYPNDIPQT